jgi:hypothetical protein
MMGSKGIMASIQQLEQKVESRWLRMARWARWVIVILVVLLVAARLALPWAIKDYVNKRLQHIPDYSGSIGDIDVHLWRGAYEIRSIKIFKSSGEVPVPFFSSPSIDLAVEWRELFHRSLVATVVMTKPEVNFVNGPTKDQTQSGFNQPWGKTLASFFPTRINRFEIKDGQIHFQDFVKKQPVDLYMTNLYAVATNLTNTRKVGQTLPAGLNANGQTLGGGFFAMDLKMDPLNTSPTFELNASLTNVDVVALNNFLQSYGKFDVDRGNFDLFTSVASVNGDYTGHAKIMFRDLKVFSWEKEKKKSIFGIAKEAVVGLLAQGLKNHPHDQLASSVPISGSFKNSHVDIWGAIGSLLHNAFIRALVPAIDNPVHLEDVEKKIGSGAEKLPSPDNPADEIKAP